MVVFNLISSGDAAVSCFNWSKEFKKVNRDHLAVEITSKQYLYWLLNKAY